MIALAAEQSVLGDLTVNLVATVVGVFLALLAERAVERKRDKEAKHDRVSEWLDIIKKGAVANAGYVKQMMTDELPHGQVPTYRTDQVLAVALHQGAARDLIGVPGLVDAHRVAVFDLAHLDNKLDLLMALQHSTHFALQVEFTIKIAHGAQEALAKLLAKCDEAERTLPTLLLDS